jgi:S1/P1 Nuclease
LPFLVLLAAILFAHPAAAWFAEGHKIVAVIAAHNLKPTARSHVVRILGAGDQPSDVERALAAASIWPDTKFREQDPATASWHYIDACLQDTQQKFPQRCPNGNCVTAKIDEYAHRLRDADYDRWGAAGDLAFLIHFVGDIHQPLHDASNADRGGTCQQVNVVPAEANLHFVWDDGVVVVLESQLGTTGPEATARKLEQLYPAAKNSFEWRSGAAEQIAWQSHQLAKSEVYRALGIPKRPCTPSACDHATSTPIALSQDYMKREASVAGRQLARAGYRLALLLNQIWPSPNPR